MRGREGGRRDEHPKEKAMRSIFGELDSSRLHLLCVPAFAFSIKLCFFAVANIAFETTEEQLRTVLSEVGPVINLK